MYCTTESIGNPDCDQFFEVVNQVPRLPEPVKNISINIVENTTNILQNETRFFYEFEVTDEDGPFPISPACSVRDLQKSEIELVFLSFD